MPNRLEHFSRRGLITGCIALGILLGVARSQQITSEKLVSAYNDVDQINDAVLISNIAVAGKTIECGLFIKPPAVVQPVTPFQAGSDWLQQMTIFARQPYEQNYRVWRNTAALLGYRGLPVFTLRRGRDSPRPNACH